jgi:hypothetical protein
MPTLSLLPVMYFLPKLCFPSLSVVIIHLRRLGMLENYAHRRQWIKVRGSLAHQSVRSHESVAGAALAACVTTPMHAHFELACHVVVAYTLLISKSCKDRAAVLPSLAAQLDKFLRVQVCFHQINYKQLIVMTI